MASWTDGPEYAPAERPDAFAAPTAPPLDEAPPLVDLSHGAPLIPPTTFEEPRDRVPSLASLVARPPESRDPAQPFVVESAVMTAGTAWGSAHSAAAIAAPSWQPPAGGGWTADQPYASNYLPPTGPGSFPAPGTPQWFGPGPEWAPPAPAVPATVANVARAATYGLLITLVLGGVISLLAPFLLGIGLAISSQVSHRRRQVRMAFWVVIGVALASGAIPVVGGGGLGTVYDTISLVALLGCWVMLVTVLFLQYAALSAGERPETPPY